MKYDNLRKLKRNQAVVDMRESHPDLSLEEIAEVFNISKQRIYEILAAAKKASADASKNVV